MFMYTYCYVCPVLYILFSLCCSMYCLCVNAEMFPKILSCHYCTCFSCSPPDLNLVVTNFMFCIYVK